MRSYKARIEKLEGGKGQKIFIAIGRGPEGYDTSEGIMTRAEVDQIEKSGRKMNRIEGDWRGV